MPNEQASLPLPRLVSEFFLKKHQKGKEFLILTSGFGFVSMLYSMRLMVAAEIFGFKTGHAEPIFQVPHH